jgi:hypothetical protein
MKAWLQLVSIGVIGGLLASSCVITSDDDDDDGEGGEAGEESTGGRRPTGGAPATGGRATGGTGTGGATGGVSTGGVGTGGSATGGKGTDACDVEEFKPAASCTFQDPDDCATCLSSNCCDELKECYSDDPVESRCGYGITSSDDSEFDCSAACLAEIYAEGDVPTEDDVDDCVGACMTCSLPNLGTLGLSQCVVNECLDECLGG